MSKNFKYISLVLILIGLQSQSVSACTAGTWTCRSGCNTYCSTSDYTGSGVVNQSTDCASGYPGGCCGVTSQQCSYNAPPTTSTTVPSGGCSFSSTLASPAAPLVCSTNFSCTCCSANTGCYNGTDGSGHPLNGSYSQQITSGTCSAWESSADLSGSGCGVCNSVVGGQTGSTWPNVTWSASGITTSCSPGVTTTTSTTTTTTTHAATTTVATTAVAATTTIVVTTTVVSGGGGGGGGMAKIFTGSGASSASGASSSYPASAASTATQVLCNGQTYLSVNPTTNKCDDGTQSIRNPCKGGTSTNPNMLCIPSQDGYGPAINGSSPKRQRGL